MTGPTDDDQRVSPETGATAREEERLRRAFALIAAEATAASTGAGADADTSTDASADADASTDASTDAGAGGRADERSDERAGVLSGERPAPFRAPAPDLPVPPRLLHRPRVVSPVRRRARAIGSALVALAACATLFTVAVRTSGGDADTALGGSSDDKAAAKSVRGCDSVRTVVRGEVTAVRTLPDGRVRLGLRVSDWVRPPSGEPTARWDVPALAGDPYAVGQRVLLEVRAAEEVSVRVTTGERAIERRLRVLGCD